jgi:hypothetical protein
MPKSTSSWLGNTAALLFFAAFAVAFTWPLAGRLGDVVIGESAGDNFAFIWNFWWARVASGAGRSFFWTDDLFAPLGTSLVLHTTTPAIAVPMATVSGADPVVLYNAALILAVFLNGVTAYAAASALTRDRIASALAGLVFAGSPFLVVRLQGHLSVLSAWGMPLLFLAVRQLAITWTAGAALATAGCLALLAYVDYYYAIFGAVLTGLWLFSSGWSVRVTPRPLTAPRRGVMAAAALLGCVALALMAWIGMTGGTDATVAGRPISIRGTFNPRAAAWILGGVVLLAWKWPRIRVIRLETGRFPWKALMALATVAVVTAVLLLPVLVAGVRLWLAGDYVTQPFSWRSAPGGLDLAALVSGNPDNAITGGWTRGLYQRFGINAMESAAWPGIVPVLLILTTVRHLRLDPAARRLFWIAVVFLVWAFGPYLMVFGYNTAIVLPQAFLKFVPILSNARIPGRAFVVVQLMLALGSAIGLAWLRQSPRGTMLALVAVLLALVDYWPGRHDVVAVDRPALYTTLRAQPPGIVLELPMGIRDGFGARGDLDHRIFHYQTIHEHPLAGGNLSRISPRITKAYEQDPVLGPLLFFSTPPTPYSRGTGAPYTCRGSLACSIRYLVVNEARASGGLKTAIDRMFESRLIERDGNRALYAVEALRTCECEGNLFTP